MTLQHLYSWKLKWQNTPSFALNEFHVSTNTMQFLILYLPVNSSCFPVYPSFSPVSLKSLEFHRNFQVVRGFFDVKCIGIEMYLILFARSVHKNIVNRIEAKFCEKNTGNQRRVKVTLQINFTHLRQAYVSLITFNMRNREMEKRWRGEEVKKER